MTISLRARAVQKLLETQNPFSPDFAVERQRALVDRGLQVPLRSVHVDPVRIAGLDATQVRPKGPAPTDHILHFHPGGFVVGSSRMGTPMLARLAVSTRSVVISVDYRRAPENPYPAAAEDGLAAYRALLEQVPADRITIAGESAGGNLALNTLVRARDAGLPLPNGAVLGSPWLDLTNSSPSHTSNADTELVLCDGILDTWRDLYVGDADPSDPGVSPVFADLTGLPPLHVQATTTEILEHDARALVQAATSAGVEIEAIYHDDLWHAFMAMMPLLPEAGEAVDLMADFIRRGRA